MTGTGMISAVEGKLTVGEFMIRKPIFGLFLSS